PLAVDEALMKLTLRVVGKALFSVDLLGAARELGDAFTEVSAYTNYRMQTPFPPPLWVPTTRNRRFKKALAALDRTIYALLDQRRQAHAAGQTDAAGDLLDMLMAARDQETGKGMSDQELRNEVALLMFAGHDTTATALTWAFYLLSQNPEAEAKLHAELARELAGRTPTMADLPRLSYTKMVIEETLRLYPPAWGVGRQSVDADLVGGYAIPPNASLTLPFYVLHRDPRWWEDPERFDPDRFTPERSARRHKFAYLPFGAGPRQCIGNNFAMMEAQLVLATVAQRYRLKLVPGHRVEPNPIFVLRTSDGLPMFIERR
ncbi:MAG: cytochrome P450, partial [Caldilineaceae bacterium]|nr:cytochrome P450 [Caldilineaceae bacterium]